MAKIKPTVFPGNLGTADEIRVKTFFNLEDPTARIIYQLYDNINKKTVTQGSVLLPEEIYNQWGTDNKIIIDWVIQELGLELLEA